MFALTVTTAPTAAPVSAEQLRNRLRLNSDAEDADLVELLAAAVELFEHDSGRPVLATSYRQDFSAWPTDGAIVLGRGGVSAVSAVSYYGADGEPVELAADQWRADLVTPPARVQLAAIPAAVTTDAGIPVTPVGCVEFVAGWSDAAAVPAGVLTALKLLAAHWYEHREAWREGELRETPDGWKRFVAKYKLGVTGPWGQ